MMRDQLIMLAMNWILSNIKQGGWAGTQNIDCCNLKEEKNDKQ